MQFNRLKQLFMVMLLLVIAGNYVVNAAEPMQPTNKINPAQKSKNASEKREDYFVSVDTIIIGCTAGAAAGVLVAGIPLAGAIVTGFGVQENFILLGNLTGMGCGVGAASSVVAILTAWLMNYVKENIPLIK